MPEQLLVQAIKALVYYAALIVIMRLAGKRLAGQTTTFDLIVLITLGRRHSEYRAARKGGLTRWYSL